MPQNAAVSRGFNDPCTLAPAMTPPRLASLPPPQHNRVMPPDTNLDEFGRALARLPMLQAVEWRPTATGPGGLDLVLSTSQATRAFVVHHLHGDVTSAAVDRLAGEVAVPHDHIVLARYVPAAPGERLRNADWNYVDAVGNCRISVDDRFFWFVEGRRPKANSLHGFARADQEAAVRFSLLADPELSLLSPAELAQVSNAPVAIARAVLTRLRREGTARPAAVRQWLAAYEGGLRQRLMLGSFRPRDPHPDALEPLLQAALQGQRWAWGGGFAAHRMTGDYRGPHCVVHVDAIPADLPRIVRALPDERGALTFLRPPSPVGYRGVVEGVAHPLLVYADLLTGDSDRAHEAATEIGAQFLELP